ncbi:Regulator of chromosome condensation, partial [Globisporangium splendens]
MPNEQHATDCAVVAFGCNDDGQLGRGEKRRLTGPIDDVSPAHFPQQIEEIFALDIAAVSCGSRHTMVLTTQGEVYSWGWGSVRSVASCRWILFAMGQLGHGDLKSSNAPRKIEFFATQRLFVEYISCGGCHSAAVTKDGASCGVVDNFSVRCSQLIVFVETVPTVDTGTVYTWGEAHWGQLGLPKEFSDLHQSLPAKCPVLQDGSEEKVVKISCGGAHTAALTDKGHVYMWGRCDNGQLGIGQAWLHDSDCEGLLGVSRPHRVEGFGDEKVVQVACGAFHSAAVTEVGSVYIWGKEDYGMLGVGQTSDIQVPQKIELFETMPALRVSCGGWHTVVVTKSGACYSFGRGEYGRLGLGDTRSRYKPQQAG